VDALAAQHFDEPDAGERQHQEEVCVLHAAFRHAVRVDRRDEVDAEGRGFEIARSGLLEGGDQAPHRGLLLVEEVFEPNQLQPGTAHPFDLGGRQWPRHSAFRLVRQLRLEGFLDESGSNLRLVRLEELLRRWQADSLRPARDVPMRWILRGDPARQLQDALRAEARESAALAPRSRRAAAPSPRLCLGLFAAADALGLGFVHGVAPLVYFERLEPGVLERLGLSLEAPGVSPDIYIRVPAARESVFRGAVLRDGVPVSDVVQVWLGAGAYPARGPEQADMIYRKVLKPLLDKARR
jgi:hypothetical protein